MTDIAVGDTWTLLPTDGLGSGFGAIPAGAEVIVDEILPPFSPGVAQVDENVICCIYSFTDFMYDASGVFVEGVNTRRLALAESDFRAVFGPAGSGG